MKRDGVAAPVRQHVVVPHVVLQVPDVRIRDARATLGGDGSVVSGIGVDHRNCSVINAIVRCIFRALEAGLWQSPAINPIKKNNASYS